MCCDISAQDRVRVIANFSIILCITSTILGGISWLLHDDPTLKQTNHINNATNISCDIILQNECNITTADVYDGAQNEMGIRVILIIFQLVIDLPASVLLLIGANLRIKQLLVPWMLIMAVKMLGYVIACCIYVQFVLVKMLDENMGFGMKHYSKPTNNTNEQHFSIFSGSAVDNIVQKRFFQNQIFSIKYCDNRYNNILIVLITYITYLLIH